MLNDFICLIVSLLAVRRECENYNLTSQAEQDDNDDEEVVMRSRNRTKKKIPEGFLSNGMFSHSQVIDTLLGVS